MTPGTKHHRTQEERRAATRAKVLDATIASLIDLGYASTTSAVVSERAGVSRGAQLHHFPTKAELVTAAVDHLAQQIGQELRTAASKLPTHAKRVDAAIDLLWQHFAGPLFPALLELMVAARTDTELQVVMRDVNDRLAIAIERQTREVFGEGAAASRSFKLMMEMTFDLLSGMALRRATWTGDPRTLKRLERQVIATWKAIATGLLGSEEIGPVAAHSD
jgi:AcrR family transcriptional regulator